MTTDNTGSPRRAPHLAAMFQKAYAQAVMIQGIDEQMNAMIEQREKIEAEILEIQSQINGEFERMLMAAKQARLRLRSQVAQVSKVVEVPPNLKLPGVLTQSASARIVS